MFLEWRLSWQEIFHLNCLWVFRCHQLVLSHAHARNLSIRDLLLRVRVVRRNDSIDFIDPDVEFATSPRNDSHLRWVEAILGWVITSVGITRPRSRAEMTRENHAKRSFPAFPHELIYIFIAIFKRDAMMLIFHATEHSPREQKQPRLLMENSLALEVFTFVSARESLKTRNERRKVSSPAVWSFISELLQWQPHRNV